MDNSPRSDSRTRGDLIYDAFYSGAIGGSAVALFFLLVDLIRAEPLFTPSLMGNVLFAGGDASTAQGVQLDMVAFYTITHFVMFGVIGALASTAVNEAELHARHPGLVLLALFVTFELGFTMLGAFAMPGVIARIGAVYIAAANLLAAGGMGLFFMATHQTRFWQWVKHAAGSA
jgi:hypothetical protein